ncbi:hypothetical protein ACFYTQ_04025 [Nocardia sp. NPDC004068]|uniref:hypothetical protein n=1 Tax=Nocardia sp. NPDC004068 TaxID=3364303 RepID=UPI0036B6676F
MSELRLPRRQWLDMARLIAGVAAAGTLISVGVAVLPDGGRPQPTPTREIMDQPISKPLPTQQP